MPIRTIRTVGDPILRRKAAKIKQVDPLILQLLDDMAQTMYAEPGIGLAAPQVGVSKRAIVVDVGEGLIKLINPRITDSEGSDVDTEGCLSIPGKVGDVERATKIMVKAMNTEGKYYKFEAEGLLARCIQHEIDHLDGILFIDKATNIREPKPEIVEAPEVVEEQEAVGEVNEGKEHKEQLQAGEKEEHVEKSELKARQAIPVDVLDWQPVAIFEEDPGGSRKL